MRLGHHGNARLNAALTPPAPPLPRCNPFDLTISNAHLQHGFNKIYDWNLAASLRRIFMGHVELWRNAKPPLRPDLVPSAKTIRDFDEAITIHSFGEQSEGAQKGGLAARAALDAANPGTGMVHALPMQPAPGSRTAASNRGPAQRMRPPPAPAHPTPQAGRTWTRITPARAVRAA